MGKIVINGTTIDVVGNCSNISIRNGEARIDGNVIKTGLSGDVHVHWDGPIANLETDGSATVNGNVSGSVNAGGSVTCGEVGTSLSAGGSVRCNKVGGAISAGGSIRVS